MPALHVLHVLHVLPAKVKDSDAFREVKALRRVFSAQRLPAGFATPNLACFLVPCGSLSFLRFLAPGMKDSKYVISTVGKPDYVETSDSMYILTPFMNSGDLFGLMKKCVETDGCRCSKGGIARTCWDKIGGPYSNAYVLALFYQAVLGVQDMHSKGLVHMDIKLENIMVNCVAGKFLGE